MKFGHSGCKMCPFRSDEEWLAMQTDHPEDFEEACRYDEAIRHSLPKMKGEAFIHDSLKPLRSIDFNLLLKEREGTLRLQPSCGGAECRT